MLPICGAHVVAWSGRVGILLIDQEIPSLQVKLPISGAHVVAWSGRVGILGARGKPSTT